MAEFRVTAPRDTSAMGALYGVDVPTPPPAQPFPAANSVDWLQQRLPKALGDWLGNAYAEGQQWSNEISDPRKLAGEAISGAMNIIPGGRMGIRPSTRVSVGDYALAGRNNEPVKQFMVEQEGMKGRLHVTPDGVVRNSFLHPELRGQGLGRSLYETAADYFGDRGVPLRSDIGVSPDAARMYESLKRNGYDVTERSPTATTDPVFTVWPRKTTIPISAAASQDQSQ